MRDDDVEVEVFGVDQFGVGRAVREDLGVEVGPRKQDRLGLAEHPGGPDGQQIRGTGAGADESHGTVVLHRSAV